MDGAQAPAAATPPASTAPLLQVTDLRKHFALKREQLFVPPATVKAVDGVSFDVAPGETLGIVGESGCGKSTTARLVMHLIQPDAGRIVVEGEAIDGTSPASLTALRRRVQMVFQDSYASLNPRLTVADSIAFGPSHHGISREAALRRARDLLGTVGLEPSQFAGRYPHQLSGGQRQRINCARALAMQPKLLILDEAVSALDKSVEAQMLNLLGDLKTRFGLTYVFISHDLNVVRYVSNRVLVMYLGRVAEVGPVADIYRAPRHPYTQALLASRPSMDPEIRLERSPLTGDPPNPVDPPSGCLFRTRCPHAEAVCASRAPALAGPAEGTAHRVACHMADAGSGHSRAGS